MFPRLFPLVKKTLVTAGRVTYMFVLKDFHSKNTIFNINFVIKNDFKKQRKLATYCIHIMIFSNFISYSLPKITWKNNRFSCKLLVHSLIENVPVSRQFSAAKYQFPHGVTGV